MHWQEVTMWASQLVLVATIKGVLGLSHRHAMVPPNANPTNSLDTQIGSTESSRRT